MNKALIKVVDSPEKPVLLVNEVNLKSSFKYFSLNAEKIYGIRFALLAEGLAIPWLRERLPQIFEARKVDAGASPLVIEDFFNFKHIEELAVVSVAREVDFSRLQSLKSLSLPWPQKTKNIEALQKLEWLSVQRHLYKNGGTIKAFKNLKNLRSLSIDDQIVTNLDGMEYLSSLSELNIYKCRCLTKIAGVAQSNIKKLYLYASNNIEDFDALGSISTLGINCYAYNEIKKYFIYS